MLWEKRKQFVLLKKINPVLLLILFSILIFIARKVLFPDYSDAAVVGMIEQLLGRFGPLSLFYLMAVYLLCSFFFIPILIPLNMVCGALYGPVLGSVIAMTGILLSCVASTLSVRYVFRGLGSYAMDHPDVKKFLNQITRHGIVVVVIVRLAFIVPYLVQNMILAMSNIPLSRLLALTLVGSLPGVVSYSFLGAGLVNLDDASVYGVYLGVPLFLLVTVTAVIHFLHKRHAPGRQDD